MNSIFSFQINNPALQIHHFVFLLFSLCTKSLHNTEKCPSISHESFLEWMLMGNGIIFAVILLFFILLKIKLLDYISEKLCSAVCLTIFTIIMVGAALLFNIISMIYSLIVYFSYKMTDCKELELFSMFSAYIFILIDLIIVFSLFYLCFGNYFRKDDDLSMGYQGIELKEKKDFNNGNNIN